MKGGREGGRGGEGRKELLCLLRGDGFGGRLFSQCVHDCV